MSERTLGVSAFVHETRGRLPSLPRADMCCGRRERARIAKPVPSSWQRWRRVEIIDGIATESVIPLCIWASRREMVVDNLIRFGPCRAGMHTQPPTVPHGTSRPTADTRKYRKLCAPRAPKAPFCVGMLVHKSQIQYAQNTKILYRIRPRGPATP
jgi:hypothetical protein